MGKRVFEVNSIEDLGLLAVEIELYAKELQPKVERIIQRTADVGRNSALYDYTGNSEGDNTNVRVSTERVAPLKSAVVATGPDVFFNEFGAGADTDTSHPYAGMVEVPVAAGSWSSSPQGEGEYAKYGSWHHPRHTKWFGLAPSRAMWNARQLMEREVPNIVKEVFK